MTPLSFRALDVDVRIDVEREALAPHIAWMTSTFAPAERAEADLEYGVGEGGRPRLVRAGTPRREACHDLDLPLELSMALIDDVLGRCASPLVVHGAAVAREGRAIALVGPSGAGKSTLALALVARGHGYLSDEWLAIDADATVRGYCRPIAFDPPLAREVGAAGEAHALPYVDVEGAHATLVLVRPPRRQLVHGARRLAAIVIPRYAPDEPSRIERLPASAALAHVWREVRAPSKEALGAALDVLERVPAYALVTSALDAACDAVERLW